MNAKLDGQAYWNSLTARRRAVAWWTAWLMLTLVGNILLDWLAPTINGVVARGAAMVGGFLVTGLLAAYRPVWLERGSAPVAALIRMAGPLVGTVLALIGLAVVFAIIGLVAFGIRQL